MKTVKQKQSRKLRMAGVPVAAAMIALSITATGFLPPAHVYAQSGGQASAVDSVFKLSNSKALRKAANSGMVTPVNQSVTKNGVKITVTEVMLDEAQLAIGVMQHAPDGNKKFMTADLVLNGKEITESLNMLEKEIDDQTASQTFQWANLGQFPDQSNVKLKLKLMADRKNWRESAPEEVEFDLKLTKSAVQSKTITPNATKTFGDTTVTVKQILMSPLQTAVQVEVKRPLDEKYPEYKSPSFELTNEQGVAAEYYGYNGDRTGMKGQEDDVYVRNYIMLFAPFQTPPQSLKLAPAYVTDKISETEEDIVRPMVKVPMDRKPTAEKPIVLEVGDSKRIKINDVEYLKDRTLVHYQTEGKYFSPLILEDEKGEAIYLNDRDSLKKQDYFGLKVYPFTGWEQTLVDSETDTYVAQFPALDPARKLTFTMSEEKPLKKSYLPELDITVPVAP
ncbi:hypothetical protein QJ48_34650 [Paenibacillus sp. A3]|uniref:DUF4179 domain-containing protein n=1 Tax=Paenibacillus sp. A3 TaxID=1337054 RepID=UPI0006D5B4E6|nr:DUF4179 domain-containing protein [Paenibacillus sp. A3]KPV55167.1 hypothetical protein QJ48_34650 [Paenibacillus sp. A3]